MLASIRLLAISFLCLSLISCAAKRPPSELGIHGLDKLNFKKHWGRSEIKELPSILWEDEIIQHAIYAWRKPGGNGLLFATNKRLLFVDKGKIYGLSVEDFGYDKITSIRYSTGLLSGKIIVFAEGNKTEFGDVDKDAARNFSEFVRTLIDK